MSKSTNPIANFDEAAEFAANYYSVLPRHITAIYEGTRRLVRGDGGAADTSYRSPTSLLKDMEHMERWNGTLNSGWVWSVFG